jgi:NitT/TauT family transport system ATP-binding protein
MSEDRAVQIHDLCPPDLAPASGADESPILSVDHVSVTFDAPKGAPNGALGALHDVSFQVRQGEFVCLVGPSGCGKSTLLRVLAGLLRPTRGRVRLRDAPLDSPSRDVGIVFQKSNLMPWRTALHNITLPLEIQGVARDEARRRAQELIRLVGLEGFEGSRPRELSGGMAQRVAIARALVHDPQILLLDEPFGALDALTRERMNMELLRIWHARRKTVVMVTHSIQEAILLSDRVLVMSARPGQITARTAITLPRPRAQELVYSEAFASYARSIREKIE